MAKRATSGVAPSAFTAIEFTLHGQTQRLPYEKAFALGCSLLEKGELPHAALVFQRLAKFTDRGPRAVIMWAFCEAAARHFKRCRDVLTRVFGDDRRQVSETLHDAFVFYHIGLRQEAITAMTELANGNRDLPTICLLLGKMLAAVAKPSLARKCWALAIRRDRSGGAVASVARQQLARALAGP